MRLPLFPLDLVLFPGALVPLHIFEPRYRTLLADCLAGDRRFGIVPSGPDGSGPATGAIGTIGMIRAAQPLPDGRSTIVVEGEARFMVRRLLDEGTPYPLALVDVFDDDPEDAADAAAHVPVLRQLGDRCALALRLLTEGPPAPGWAADAGGLTFQVAALLDVDPTFKQRFLAIRSPEHRARLLLTILPPIVINLEARAAVKQRAGTNGQGGAHPDIVVDHAS
jgi:Lon protease-like protein